jgi:ABC-type phosphate transport system substrate-binding protein
MLLVINKNVRFAYAAAGLLGAAVLGTSPVARAQDAGPPLCSSYNTGNVVYFTGSTAVQPVLQSLAKSFAAAQVNIGIAYVQGIGSCVGLSDMLSLNKEKAGPVYIKPDGTTTPCGLTDTVAGQTIDVAVSDVFPATCTATNNTPPVGSGFKEFLGPIQVMTMVTRKESTESSISADAAYTVFGFGGQTYPVAPWTDSTQMYIRGSGSGTINMIGTAIGLAATKWLVGTQYDAQRKGGSGAVLSALQTSSTANASIGILAADFADRFRNPAAPSDGGAAPPAIKILAYKHTGQSCGYLPDSDSTHFDKINVRQGRYAIWGPVHLVAAVDGTGTPTNPNVATIIQYLSSVGRTPDQTLTAAQKQSMIDAQADAFTIPWCAMQVERSGEISTPTAFAPTEPCGCYYESHKTSIVSTCTACTDNTGCSGTTPVCRYGYCEAR